MVSAGIYQLSDDALNQYPKKRRDYEGVVKDRWTTDIIFALLIWQMWGAMSYVGYTGIKNGNVYRLIAPVDYNGNACGFEGPKYATNKYFYTVMPNGLGVCTPSCPDLNSADNSTSADDYYCFTSSLVPTTPALFAEYIKASCFGRDGKYDISSGCLCNLKRKTVNLARRCRFADTAVRLQYSSQSAPPYFQAFIADIYTARNVIFGFGFGLAIFLSFCWSHLIEIKWIAFVLVWTGLLGTFTVMLAMGCVGQQTVETWRREDPAFHTEDETLALHIFVWIIFSASVLFLCLMVFLRKQINLSIKMISLTSSCINDLQFIVFTPILNLIAFGMFLVPCFIYMFYVASDGSFEPIFTNLQMIGMQYKPSPGVVSRLWFLFFCLLWTMNWLGGMSAITIAIACATWYFTEDRNENSLNSWAVLGAYGTTIRYHWGTAAFGSLLIAFVQFIRWLFLYIQKYYNKINDGSPLVQYICCCVQCCLYCLECAIKFVSKQAYIQTAINGTGFLMSAKEAFFLLARNIFRVGAIHVFGGLALFTGKIFIIACTVACSFFYLNSAFSSDLHGIVGPIVLIGIIAWFTTSMFMDVYQMCLDTIFQCFVADEEDNGGNSKYVDGDFKTFIEDNGKIEPGKAGTVRDDQSAVTIST